MNFEFKKPARPERRLSIFSWQRHNGRAQLSAPKFTTSSRPASRDAIGKVAMTGSSEFTTWVALAGAAILAGLCAIYSSSPWVLIVAALLGAFLGYKGEQIGRRWLDRYLSQGRYR